MSPLLKFHYLYSYVQGKALEILKRHKLTAVNYPRVWKDLVSHYERTMRPVNSNLSDLLHKKPLKFESYSDIKRLKKDINGESGSSRFLGKPAEHRDYVDVTSITPRSDHRDSKV